MKKGTKRKAISTGIMEEEAAAAATITTTSSGQQQNKEEPTKAVVHRTKRSRSSKPETEPEFFPEQHDFEDLWKQVFPVGIDWNLIDTLYQYNWNFSNLEAAFEDGGILHGKKVYLFGAAEPRLIHTGESCVPVVVAIVSPFPPSDKIGVASVQRGEEILDMKQMKMDWVPYIPLGKQGSPVERLKESQIFILSCVQRRAGLRQLKLDRVKEFEYCLPYFYNPLKEDKIEQSMEFYKFYPVATPDTPDFLTSPYINRYYGKAHKVL